ncbi:hypothetical protein V070_00927 [Staphylococcus aureus C0673]|nr:hypothetical protein V070_00927 [Staphylococcus aureus C0673]
MEETNIEKITYLFVGESPYFKDKKKEEREYYNIKPEFDYPTELVAFFPEYVNNHKGNIFKITTYKRIIGLLNNDRVSVDDSSNYDSPINIVKKYKEQSIYFCNLSELKNLITFSENSLKITKNEKTWIIDSTTKILCFGSEAINHFTHTDLYKYKLKIATFPHPSPNNYNVFWKHYDKDFNPIIHNLDINLLPPTP